MCHTSISPAPHFCFFLKAHVPRSSKAAYFDSLVVAEVFLEVIKLLYIKKKSVTGIPWLCCAPDIYTIWLAYPDYCHVSWVWILCSSTMKNLYHLQTSPPSFLKEV